LPSSRSRRAIRNGARPISRQPFLVGSGFQPLKNGWSGIANAKAQPATRQEFEQFLARQGEHVSAASDPERKQLFEEFLKSSSGTEPGLSAPSYPVRGTDSAYKKCGAPFLYPAGAQRFWLRAVIRQPHGRLSRPLHSSLFIIRDFDVADEIADDLELIGIVIRNLHADEFIFDQYHQLEVIEPVGAEIVTEVPSSVTRLISNTQILGNQTAHFIGITVLLCGCSLSRAQATEGS
jgi:hypothetical protein